ncbi:Protein REPRESSOR OF SILENCING 3 [Linum grandiflorum]
MHPNPTTQNKSSGVLFSDSLLDLRLPSLSDLCRSVNLSPASNHGHGVSAWKSESLLSRLGLYQYSTVGVGWGRLSVLSSSPSNCFLRLLWFVLFPLVYQSSDFFGIGEALVSFSAVDFGHPPVTGVVRIFVGGLGESVTDDDLRNIFSSLSRGLGKYNGCVWKGGKLRLEKAKDDYLSRLKKEWDEEEEEEN